VKIDCVLAKMDSLCSWLVPPDMLTLIQDEVHVWRAFLERSPHQVRMRKQLLSADELAKAGRFHLQKDRDHFIVARGLLRTILGKYLVMRPDKLRFCYGPFGKPALDEKTHGKSLRFNISHSHGLALFSFAHDREVGVDLEYIRSDLSCGNIAPQFFSLRETAALNALPENVRMKAFFTLWTRKEAVMKADGRGLALDLNQYEVLMGQNDIHMPLRLSNELRSVDMWSLWDLDAGAGFSAALAVEGQGRQLRCWQWESMSPGLQPSKE